MNSDFSRSLSLLRQEKQVSQRTAAKALGISQALLSHYENGIREPGLSFVVRACDYYNVSADFLLGRTLSRDGTTILDADTLYDASSDKDDVMRGSVMATLATTLTPTKNTIMRVAREAGKHVELVDCLVDGAFGLDQDQFRARLTESAAGIVDKVDVVVLAQGSMAYAEPHLEGVYGKPFLGSPRFGAAELKKALQAKGVI